MYKRAVFLISLVLFCVSLHAQDTATDQDPVMPKLSGYHVGVVQIVFAANGDGTKFLDQTSFYSIGFPLGVTLNTSGKVKVDLEVVPFVKPYVQTDLPYKVHVLYHPGVLFPLKHGWTFGLRLACESGQGQFGFTPLVNKAFKIGEQTVIFIELVAPGRFGPEKNSGYTQLGGLHVGFGF
ncbi:MAG TPA: hypothetical protein VI603_07405 [Saprospiraceae bacterium]|nr:hypothetical protein [Saprospiraceae bacterium]